ncbi:MAG TPA: 30S ribosomal protein S6 [Bacteroidetes bacterium]|nr:30S ribosomal protein S6 [Bacteroidota bacterium]
MRNYEVTFIVDPVLSGDEVKATAQKYVDHLQENKCSIVHVDEMGLRKLAYEINKRHSGYYYCVEFSSETGEVLAPIELLMRRDDNIMRFLTVSLDKYGVKYNEDKRAGKIGKVKRKKKPEPAESAPRKSKQPVRQPDNLKRIEGIGPKIAEVLRSSGITTFEKLAGMTPDQIKAVLTAAGDRFSFQDPTTWPAQAELAAKGKWDELKKWQEELKGGKIVVPAKKAAKKQPQAAKQEEE